MDKPRFVGIDMAAATFTSAVGRPGDKWQIGVRPATFANELDGFAHTATGSRSMASSPATA